MNKRVAKIILAVFGILAIAGIVALMATKYIKNK